MFEDIDYAALTDVGRERAENQDNYGDARLARFEFFYVCDGMGGHAGGSTAARLAVDTIHDVLNNNESGGRERLEKAILSANDAIFEKQIHQRELRGMGTTIVAIAVDKQDQVVHIAHVGDSRGYLLRQQCFRRITRDHTMVQRLVDDGVITAEEADHHPNSNVISRSLGGYPEVEVEHSVEPLAFQPGDTILLCSDGLSGLVAEPEMATILAKQSPSEAVETLVRRANEEGGHDNITVEIVRFGTFASTNPAEPIRIEHMPKGPSSRELLETERRAAEHILAKGTKPGKTGVTVALDFSGDSEDEVADDLGDGDVTPLASKRPAAFVETSTPTTAEEEYFKTRERLVLGIFLLLIVFLGLLIALLLRLGGVGETSSSALLVLAAPSMSSRWKQLVGATSATPDSRPFE